MSNNNLNYSRNFSDLNIPTPTSIPSPIILNKNEEYISKNNSQGMSIKSINHDTIPFSNYPKMHIDTSVSPTVTYEPPPAPAKTPSPTRNVIESSNLSIPITTIAPPKLPVNVRSPPKNINRSNVLRSPLKEPSMVLSPTNGNLKFISNDSLDKSLKSPIKSPPKYKTMIPISTNDKVSTPRIKIREEIYKRTPPKIESLAIQHFPQVPQIKIEPIGEIRGRSPTTIQNPTISNANIANSNVTNQNRSWFESIPSNVPVFPQKPNYSMMSIEETAHMKSIFVGKFQTLITSFPQWNIQIPDENASLDYWHDVYEGRVKQIVISMNKNTHRSYLVFFFFITQIICMKLGIKNMEKYAIKQCKMLNQYDQVLVELGEKYYLQGPSNVSAEYRLITTIALNACIFLGLNFLASWVGNEALAEPIQEVITTLLANNDFTTQVPQKDENGLSAIPTAASGSDLAGTLGGLLSGGGGLEGLGKLASTFLGGNKNSANGSGFNLQSFITNMTAAFGQNNSPSTDSKATPVRKVVFTEDD